MGKITDDDAGVARLMERVERMERELASADNAGERGRTFTFQENQQLAAMRVMKNKLSTEIGVRFFFSSY